MLLCTITMRCQDLHAAARSTCVYACFCQDLVQRHVSCLGFVNREEGQHQGGNQPQKTRGMGL